MERAFFHQRFPLNNSSSIKVQERFLHKKVINDACNFVAVSMTTGAQGPD